MSHPDSEKYLKTQRYNVMKCPQIPCISLNTLHIQQRNAGLVDYFWNRYFLTLKELFFKKFLAHPFISPIPTQTLQNKKQNTYITFG